jgi:DNA mismatch endonuclease (patch repair protein)
MVVDPIRSDMMRAVRRENTKPEMQARRVAHSLGLRFRLHRRDLPGTPDLVFPKLHTVIFVHGCFWHRHLACAKASTPKTRTEFWQAKFGSNVARDARVATELRDRGWRVIVLWECETTNPVQLRRRLRKHLLKQ